MSEPIFTLDDDDPDQIDAMLDALVEEDGGEFAERGRVRPARRLRRGGIAGAQRNGQGIKAMNDRINALDSKVDRAVRVIAQDRAAVRKLEKLGKIDGALDLAASFNGTSIDVFQVVKGSLKMGLLGEPKGALGNPAVIGAAGFLLRNPGIVRGVLGQTT